MSAAQEEFDTLMRRNNNSSSTRHTHPTDDNSDAQSFLNLSEDEDSDNTPTPHRKAIRSRAAAAPTSRPSYSSSSTTTTTAARSTIPKTRYEANTGPKGVISDAQNFRDARRDRRVSMGRASASLGSLVAPQTQQLGDRLQGMGFGEREDAEKILEELELEREGEEEDGDGDGDEGDEGFMREWRLRRLREMQSGGPPEGVLGRGKGGGFVGGAGAGGARRFGTLQAVDGEGYLEAVDGSGHGTVVVVYIYDDMSDVSQAIESCIRTLAAKHLDARFVKLHYQDAEMEPAGVPALIAYQNGDKFADLVPIMEALPDDADLSALTLEMVMKRHQILR